MKAHWDIHVTIKSKMRSEINWLHLSLDSRILAPPFSNRKWGCMRDSRTPSHLQFCAWGSSFYSRSNCPHEGWGSLTAGKYLLSMRILESSAWIYRKEYWFRLKCKLKAMAIPTCFVGKQAKVRFCDAAWLRASSAKGERRPIYHFLLSVGFPKTWQSVYFHIYISWFSHSEEELVLKCQSAGLEQVGAAPFLPQGVEAGLERRRGHWAGSLPVGSSSGLRSSMHALHCKQSSEHPPRQPAVSALILESASGVCLLHMKVSTVFCGGECIVQTLLQCGLSMVG